MGMRARFPTDSRIVVSVMGDSHHPQAHLRCQIDQTAVLNTIKKNIPPKTDTRENVGEAEGTGLFL
jgi:hypothetical protein